ncbi:MAG: ATP-binding protein [Pseudomonadota bacterium]
MTAAAATKKGRQWALTTQLRVGFAVALFMVLGVSGVAWRVALDYRDDIKLAYQEHLLTTVQLAEAESALWQLRYGFPQFMIGSEAEQQRILTEQDTWYAIIEKRLAEYEQATTDPQERAQLDRLLTAYHRYKAARPKFFELWMAGEKDAAIAWRARTTTPYGAETVQAFAAQIALQRTHIQREQARTEREVQLVLGLVAAITLVQFTILAIAFVSSRRLLRRIRALRTHALAVVHKQLGETIDAATSGNEVMALEESIQLMSGRLLAHNALLRQFNEALEAKVAERTEALAMALAAATESDRMKSEFMNAVTHELRTPLNGVIGFAELLKDEVAGPLNPQQAEFVADIHASGLRLLKLVEGILDMSRLDAGGEAGKAEPVDIAALLQERAAAHRSAAEARGITLEVDAAAGHARLDPQALRRILDALLDNAIKFNRDTGTIRIGAHRVQGRLEIVITDTGIGIAPADLPKLFQPLVQLDGALARQYGGIGLGLALAQRLAQRLGGTIEVKSEVGKGSTFTLRLPMEEETT